MRKHKDNDVMLDNEEQEIYDALENGQLKSVDNFDKERTFAQAAAANHFKKDARMNIRISSNDLQQLKLKAAHKGLPYQTYIASILHEVAAGHFKNI